MWESKAPSLIESLMMHEAEKRHVNIYIKRDDLLSTAVEGNKYRKLKYNMKYVVDERFTSMTTCGGAYSNHLLAVSKAGALAGLPTRGLLNAPWADINNETLGACRTNGMELLLLDRDTFKAKVRHYTHNGTGIQGDFFIPEGGSNELALRGCAEIMVEITQQVPGCTHVIVPNGTGGTIAGMCTFDSTDIKLIGVPVLKFDMHAHIKQAFPFHDFSGITFWQAYHFGGYAKFNDALLNFIRVFYRRTGIVLDPVYNAKGMFALMDKIQSGYFPAGSNIVYLHTGGSQGIAGFNRRFGYKLPG